MAESWRNWTGDQRCAPAELVRPRDRDELAAAVVAAAEAGRKVSVAGSGHSFTEAALTDGTMIDAGALSGVIEADRDSGLVKVGGGTVLAVLNEELHRLGLAMENLGDIDRQTVAGAIATGTHGTGAKLRNISAQVEAIELVTADGTVRELDSSRAGPAARRPCRRRRARRRLRGDAALRSRLRARADRLAAAARGGARRLRRAGRGERPLRALHLPLRGLGAGAGAQPGRGRRRARAPRAAAYLNDIVLENWALEALSAAGRLVPRSIPALSRLAAALASGGRTVDRSDRVFASERRVRFTEMEYGVPRKARPGGGAAGDRVGARQPLPGLLPDRDARRRRRRRPAQPVHERDTAYIAVHQYRGMEWRPYFEAVEAIMREYGGRPHWGKRHFQTAESLAPLYPGWDSFQAARDELDPGRVFSNEYAERVLGL